MTRHLIFSTLSTVLLLSVTSPCPAQSPTQQVLDQLRLQLRMLEDAFRPPPAEVTADDQRPEAAAVEIAADADAADDAERPARTRLLEGAVRGQAESSVSLPRSLSDDDRRRADGEAERHRPPQRRGSEVDHRSREGHHRAHDGHREEMERREHDGHRRELELRDHEHHPEEMERREHDRHRREMERREHDGHGRGPELRDHEHHPEEMERREHDRHRREMERREHNRHHEEIERREHDRHREHGAVMERVAALHEAAERLAHGGLEDMAHQLHRQAEEMEREVHRRLHHREGPSPEAMLGEVMQQIEQLRGEVRQLNEKLDLILRKTSQPSPFPSAGAMSPGHGPSAEGPARFSPRPPGPGFPGRQPQRLQQKKSDAPDPFKL